MRRVLSFLSVACFASACVGALGIEPMREAPCGGFLHVEDRCAECVEQHCCEVSSKCDEDPDCRALYTCLAGCEIDAPACRASCERDHPTANDTLIGLDACRRSSCLPDCLGSGGWGELFDPSEACASCALACSEEGLACARDRACERGVACIAGCDDPQCNLDCYYESPLFTNPFIGCLKGCAGDCRLRNDFACVGEYQWAEGPVTGPLFPYQFRVVHGDTKDPLEGITVRACGVAACDACEGSVVISEAVSKPDGLVVIDLPHDFFGCVMLTGAGLFPIRAYFGRPLNTAEPFIELLMFAEDRLRLLAGLVGESLDPERGVLSGLQIDCSASLDVSVSFTVSPSDAATTDFIYGPPPSREAESGTYGIVLNVPPALVDLRAYDGDREVASAEVVVSAGLWTTVFLYPTTEH